MANGYGDMLEHSCLKLLADVTQSPQQPVRLFSGIQSSA